MPFKSAAQRRYLYAKEPEVAEEFARKEKEARMTPSTFSKPEDRPVGTTTSTSSEESVPAFKKKKKAASSMPNLKSAARRRLNNGNANSSSSY